MKGQSIADAFSDVLLTEARARDSVFYPGNFVETALIEHLHRYWLETALGKSGFSGIEREVAYAGPAVSENRKSCDLNAKCDGKRYWIEIKVAYENTGYTKEELTRDIGRLNSIPFEDGKIYFVVFVSYGEARPEKLDWIYDSFANIKPAAGEKVGRIASPAYWGEGWQNSHLHVACFSW